MIIFIKNELLILMSSTWTIFYCSLLLRTKLTPFFEFLLWSCILFSTVKCIRRYYYIHFVYIYLYFIYCDKMYDFRFGANCILCAFKVHTKIFWNQWSLCIVVYIVVYEYTYPSRVQNRLLNAMSYRVFEFKDTCPPR